MFANTTIISLAVSVFQCVCHNTYYFLQHVRTCFYVCLCASVSECNLCLWICVPLNSSPCHSGCPLFHKPVCLLSGVRWHIMFPYLCLSFPIFVFYPVVWPRYPFHYGIQSPRPWCYLLRDIWTNAALLYHPYDCLPGKIRLSSLFSCQKSRGIDW